MSRLARSALVAAAVLAWGPSSSAQPAPAQPAPTAPATTAIGHVASEIARGIGAPGDAIVVAAPITTDAPAPRADELATRIAAQVAGRLGVGRAHPQPAALAAARVLGGRASSLVHLQIELVKGVLRVTADLYPVVSNGWDRLRNPAPGPRAHAFASASIDAEVRTFMTPVLLEQAKLRRAKHGEGEVLAVGCGDLDGDGGLELALVSRTRVVVARLRAGKLVIERAAPWTQIASRVAVPMREPLAQILVSPRHHPGEILVGTTDHGGIALDASLVATRQLTGIPVADAGAAACAVAVPDASVFDGHAIACTAPANGEPRVVEKAPAGRYDAVAALDLVGKNGAVTHVVAARDPTGALRLRRESKESAFEATLGGVGAQLALADLDLDGQPELISTVDGGSDAVVVSTWNARGQIVPRLRFPAKSGVRAVAACPPEDKGAPSLVAVVGDEVWLVR
jgi:hypothetical protein